MNFTPQEAKRKEDYYSLRHDELSIACFCAFTAYCMPQQHRPGLLRASREALTRYYDGRTRSMDKFKFDIFMRKVIP